MIFSPKYNNYNNIAFALFFIVITTTTVSAQKTGISDNQDVTTALSSDVTILDRVPLSPESYIGGDTTRSIEALSSPARLLTLKYDAPSIRPLAMKRVQPKADYKKWLKLGFGLPMQPYGEGSYTSAVGARGIVGAYAKYHSANNSPALANQRFEHILAQVNGSYYIDTVAALTARIGYKNDGVNFYGYDHNTLTYSAEQTAQRFQKIYANLGFMNTSTNDADFDYKVNLDFYNLNDSYRAREQGIVLGADITKWFAEKHPFNIAIKNDYTGFNQADSVKFINNIVALPFNFTFNGDGFKVKVGANTWFTQGRFGVAPNVEGIYAINGEALAVFAGWTGNYRKNTFASLSEYNPYIISHPEFRNSRMEERFLGVKGATADFTYEVKIHNSPVENMPLYLNDSLDRRRFNVVYDTLNIFGGHANLAYRINSAIEVGTTADYRIFTPKKQTKAWHLPNLEGNVYVKYKPIDNLTLRLDAYTGIGASYLDAQKKTQALNTIIDLNLGAKYQIGDNVAVFLDANNLTNQRYQRWNQYPVIGINFIGGVILKFK